MTATCLSRTSPTSARTITLCSSKRVDPGCSTDSPCSISSTTSAGPLMSFFMRSFHAEYFYDHPLPALPVELRVEDSLPSAKVQLSTRHRKRCLVVQQQRLQMRIAVVFARLVMLVVGPF